MVFRKRLCAETDAEDISLRCLTLNLKNNIQVSWPISRVRQEHTLIRMGIMLAIHIPLCVSLCMRKPTKNYSMYLKSPCLKKAEGYITRGKNRAIHQTCHQHIQN